MSSEAFLFIQNFLTVLRNIFYYAIVARILLSWFSMGQPIQNSFTRFLRDLTNPLLRLVRILPHQAGFIDFSPLLALIFVDFVYKLSLYLVNNLL